MSENYDIELLKIPKKIDFYNYECGCGGEFFQSMITLSCNRTKNILSNDSLVTREIGNNNNIFFSKSSYKPPIRIYSQFPTVNLLSYQNIVDLYKYQIINNMINLEKGWPLFIDYKSEIYKKYKNVLFIFSNHWTIDSEKMKKLSEYEYWSFLDLNPETKFARKLICKVNRIIGMFPNNILDKPPIIEEQFDRYPFLENFPFFDCILYNDYNSIKYFIENRYGSDLDFDFIDQSLKMWKKVRVDPYL
jgi:hypothetical protein